MNQAPSSSLASAKLGLNVRPRRFAYFFLEDDQASFERIVRYTCTQWGGIRNVLGPVDISSGKLLKRRKLTLVFAVFATVQVSPAS